MPGKPPSHLDINKAVRKTLVSQWIDLGRISVHTVRTTVYLRGSLGRLPGSASPLTTSNVDALYRQISAVPGVLHVEVQLDNWSRDAVTGGWSTTDSKETRGAGLSAEGFSPDGEKPYRLD
jgi:hypothetical protein